MHRILPATLTVGVLVLAGGGVALASEGSSHPAARPAVAPRAAAAPALHTAKVKVGDDRKTVVVNAKGKPVYLLTGDSVKHPTCTSSACLRVWPAVTASKATEKGITGKVTVWTHKGIHQLVLNGHPLYLYAGDGGTASASGEGIHSFGGEWDALTPAGKAIDDGNDDDSVASTVTSTSTTPAATSTATTTSGTSGGDSGYGW